MPNKKGKRKAKSAATKSVSVADANLTLWNACANGILSSNDANVMSVQAAIAAGADVNYSYEGKSCLSIAAANGHNEVVSLLITAGVNKEAKQNGGVTALIIAAATDQGKCVDVLLTAGADKEAKEVRGATALIVAAQFGHGKCVKMLVWDKLV
jgi:ankyrin repeat protein